MADNAFSRNRSSSNADYHHSVPAPLDVSAPRPMSGRNASMPPATAHPYSMPDRSSMWDIPPKLYTAHELPQRYANQFSTSPAASRSFLQPHEMFWLQQQQNPGFGLPSPQEYPDRESRWAHSGLYPEGGIASTNVSPFTRDASVLPMALDTFGHTRQREHSLGPVGSGRRRGETVWGPARSLVFTHENVEDDGSDEGDFAPPTRSGATSRRHSLATVPSRSQIGFQVPSMTAAVARPANAEPVGLRLSDDALAASLNSLQLTVTDNLPKDAAAPSQSYRNAAAAPKLDRPPVNGPPPTVVAPARRGGLAPRGPPHQYTNPAPVVPYNASTQLDPSNRPVYFGAQTTQEPDLVEFGKGVPLHVIPKGSPLYIVEFTKNGRTDIFYVADRSLPVKRGDIVIVEADRGKDLGTVVQDSISMDDIQDFQQFQVDQATGQPSNQPATRSHREIHPKRILSKASETDLQLLTSKASDEAKALVVCQQKTMQKGLEMEITGAEWQFDRRKLTLYYIADKRIDFRELVRELFRLYKTRIWMSPVERR